MSPASNEQRPELPPGAWQPARRLIERVRGPIERFLHVEAASGIALLVAAAIGLALANSRFGEAYEHFWETPLAIRVGTFELSASLHFLINDGLMAVFFFVVGLEIRREIHAGELSELRRAALPALAALGGMLVPALVFLLLNRSPATRAGWGVPMATDIAFAVGVFALLGRRVVSGLRVLLLAVAIIDDIGAIIVIALFYSSGVNLLGLGIAAGGIALIFVLRALGLRSPLAYVPAGVVTWAGFLSAGIHPTIAGVVLGLLTPPQSWLGPRGFVSTTEDALREVRERSEHGDDARELLQPLSRVDLARREAVAPLVRLEALLHPWVAFVVMPLFALANAGVRIVGIDLDAERASVFAGVALGLIVGKPIGIVSVTWAATKLGLCGLPRRVGWTGVFVLGIAAGIGFTMAIFIAGLAYPGSSELAAAKLGVLAASGVAALAALAVGFVVLRPAEATDISPSEAEASTES